METVYLLIYALIFSAVLLFSLWAISVRKKDAGLVDVGWTAGVGVLAVAYAVVNEGWVVRQALVALMGGIWAFRLASYIVKDRIAGKPEDGRYGTLRKKWGGNANRNFFFFFISQAPLIVIFSIPFLVATRHPDPVFRIADALGLALWAVSIGGESIADRQLARFRRDPANRGKTCRAGLWRYSRHPNYFFEWLHWWSYVLVGAGAPHGWLTLVGPVVMFLFLFKVTGIPHTERQALRSRGDDYREYQRTTSMFIPWFPRK